MVSVRPVRVSPPRRRAAAVARNRGVRGKPTLSGASLALVFWWAALTPTVIPRTWTVQAVVSAVSVAIGYGIGTLVGRYAARVLDRWALSPGRGARRWLWLLLGVGWLFSLILGGPVWMGWQNEQRTFMGMAAVGWRDAVLAVVLSVVFAALLILFGRVLGAGLGALNRFTCRLLPAVVATPLTILLVVVVAGVVYRGVLVLADSNFSSTNDATEEGIVVPTSPSVSGSAESLVPWDSLGRQGRTFVASATTTEELEKFHGADATLEEPVRAYVGLHSAATPAERADLAVRELDRAGGFDRKVLVVWIPTGTGWMVNEAAVAIEQLYAGDSAIVGVQYSYLASLITGLLEPERATETGTALFNAVHAHWSQLPPDHRPKLVLFGKSLGTKAVEEPFVSADAAASVANLVSQTDGALIVGPPYNNPIFQQIRREREPGSPVWQPIFDRGRTVRVLNRDPSQPFQSLLDPQWPTPRIVYLVHPSDPATFWDFAALWWPPEWMGPPRGFDVPAATRWFPIVSGVQAIPDLINQLSTPPGFGHVFLTDYVRGWAQVAPPDGWTDADTERLEAFLHNAPEAGSGP